MLTIDMYAHTRDAELLGRGLPCSPSLDGCSRHRLTVYLRVIHQLPSLSAPPLIPSVGPSIYLFNVIKKNMQQSLYLPNLSNCHSIQLSLSVSSLSPVAPIHENQILYPLYRTRGEETEHPLSEAGLDQFVSGNSMCLRLI